MGTVSSSHSHSPPWTSCSFVVDELLLKLLPPSIVHRTSAVGLKVWLRSLIVDIVAVVAFLSSI